MTINTAYKITALDGSIVASGLSLEDAAIAILTHNGGLYDFRDDQGYLRLYHVRRPTNPWLNEFPIRHADPAILATQAAALWCSSTEDRTKIYAKVIKESMWVNRVEAEKES